MSIESVMPSNHLILCRPLLLLPSVFPNLRVFSNESALCISGQSTGVSASISVLPMNTQDWSPLGWTGWIFLQSKGLSKVFSKTTVQKHQLFRAQLSLESNSPMNTQDWSPSGWTFINRLFSSSSISVIRVVSSAYLKLLIFLPEILITAYTSSNPTISISTLHIS